MTEQRVALVTGAGSGLGRALAAELAARNIRVAGFGRRVEPLAETAALIGEDRFDGYAVDVSDPEAVREAVGKITAKWGRVNILINNAAVYPRRDVFDETGESFADTIGANLTGMFNCTRAVLDGMADSGEGHIVNVSSFADISPLPASAAYSVSKGAGRILSRALVADLSDRFPGIIISTWMPGMLATGMGIPDGLDPAVPAKWGVSLAMSRDPALNGSVFEMNLEVMPPRGLKSRVKNLLLLRRAPKPRVLEDQPL